MFLPHSYVAQVRLHTTRHHSTALATRLRQKVCTRHSLRTTANITLQTTSQKQPG